MNYDRAIRSFEAFVDSPDPALRRQARIGLALALQYRQPDRKDDKQRAEEIYNALIGDMGPTPVSPADHLLLYLRARMAADIDYPGDTPDWELADKLHRRLMDSPEAGLYAELAASESALLNLKRGDPKLSVAMLEARLAADADNPLAAAQNMLAGGTELYLLDDPASAIGRFRSALDAGIPVPTLPPSYIWGVARLADQLGKREVALEYYQRILSDFSQTLYADESLRAVRRLKGQTPDPQ